MADREFQGPEKARFPTLMLLGVALAAVVIVVAFIVDSQIGWPLLILAAICAVAAIGFRLIAGSGRAAGRGDTSGAPDTVPRQEARFERPLGDTPEAHDEINPHDLPLENPGREKAEEMSGGSDGTTRGPLPGG